MNIAWSDLRPWNASQRDAFEEICCQLAHSEPPDAKATFTPVGAPDAGVECYWTLPNGDEWGWQAKFFQSVDDSQWRQINDSVVTALSKHPRMVRYTVCLPIDLADPRIPGQEWLKDKWVNHVNRWSALAAEREMAVDFHYWGEHEIWVRLTSQPHAGRYFFWFHREVLNSEWFQHKIEEAIANVGPRYSPELNVQMPIAHIFDGLGRVDPIVKTVIGVSLR